MTEKEREEAEREEVQHTRRNYLGIGLSPRHWARAVDEREAEGYDWSPMVDAVTGASDAWYPMVYAVADGSMTLQEAWRSVERDVKEKAGKGWQGFVGLDDADIGYLKRVFKDDIREETEEMQHRERDYGFEPDPEFAERARSLGSLERAIEAGVRAALADVGRAVSSGVPEREAEGDPEDIAEFMDENCDYWQCQVCGLTAYFENFDVGCDRLYSRRTWDSPEEWEYVVMSRNEAAGEGLLDPYNSVELDYLCPNCESDEVVDGCGDVINED